MTTETTALGRPPTTAGAPDGSLEAARFQDEQWTGAMRRFYSVFPYPGRPLFMFPDVRQMGLAHLGFGRLLAQGRTTEALDVWRSFHPSARGQRNEPRSWLLRGWHRRLERRSLFETLRSAFRSGCLRGSDSSGGPILLAGCGTDEAVLYAALHPTSNVVAVDLSRRSLRRARFKWFLYRCLHPVAQWSSLRVPLGLARSPRRVQFVCSDVRKALAERAMASSGADSRFGAIVCFGVLHHQRNPRGFFADLVSALSPDGVLKIMIYSRSGRTLERASQRLLGLGVAASSALSGGWAQGFLMTVRLWLKALVLKLWLLRQSTFGGSRVAAQRFRYLGVAGQGRGLGLASVADALLHPCDPGVDPAELGQWVMDHGLRIVHCVAKSGRDGWHVGLEDPVANWEAILERERAGDVISNIELIIAR